MKRDILLIIGTKLLVPFILLFSLYVQFHGDYGPGGGFQAGVIASAMVILYTITFGVRAAKKTVPPGLVHAMIPLGVLIYAGTGVLSMLLGGNYLDYSVFGHDQAHAQEWGILAVEIGVYITVAGTMTSIFYAFAERGR